MTYAELRMPLSLLVCMISESARIPMMQRDFTNMFYGHDVLADEAIRSYDDAKYVIEYAKAIFAAYPRHLAVEKLQKRAAEMDSLLERLQSALKYDDRSQLIADLLNEGKLTNTAAGRDSIARFRDMSKEMSLRQICRQKGSSEAATIAQLISTCRNASAVRAAKQGVAIPDIGHAAKAAGDQA